MVTPDYEVERVLDDMLEDEELSIADWNHNQAGHAVAYFASLLLDYFTEPFSVHINPQERTIHIEPRAKPERLEGA